MTFWLVGGALILITLGVLVAPLLRRVKAPAPRAGHDLAVYKDQLAEVERDLARGVLEPAEAEAARHEVERRLLAVAPEPAPAPLRRRGNLVLVGALCLALPAAALGLYFYLGVPGLPSQPFAARPAPQEPPRELVEAVEQLAARLTAAPADPQGWALLGRSYGQLGRYREAAEAFRQAIDQGDQSAETYASLGEMLAAAGNGVVGPEARQAFAAALERDPNNPRSRYYAGLAYVQDGRLPEALAVWQELAADSPAQAPWRPLLEQQIAALTTELGLATTPRPQDPGPSAADVAAAAQMSAEERQAFIAAMVERLASRLEESPDDLAGWLRLARAYRVLGERAQGLAALEQARALAADLPADAPEHGAIAEIGAALEQLP